MQKRDSLRQLAKQLPRFGADVQEIDPLIRARLYLTGSQRTWYLASAGEYRGEIAFFGSEQECLYEPHARKWRRFTLSFLERVSNAAGADITIDDAFEPCRYSALSRP